MYRVPLRGLALALPVLLATTAAGAASSILVLPEATPGGATPSIVMLGDAVAAPVEARALSGEGGTEAAMAEPEIFVLGLSMIAFGAEAIPAAREAVASIGEATEQAEPRPIAETMPLVIRGGVIGDAFSAPPAELVTPPDEEEATASEEVPSQPG